MRNFFVIFSAFVFVIACGYGGGGGSDDGNAGPQATTEAIVLAANERHNQNIGSVG